MDQGGGLVLSSTQMVLLRTTWPLEGVSLEARSDGQFLLGFCINLGMGTNMEAERKALQFGINLCKDHHIALTQIETDSLRASRSSCPLLPSLLGTSLITSEL